MDILTLPKASLVAVGLGLSATALAQAPVVDLSSVDLATKVANLERVVQSRTRTQQRAQEQINDLQMELSMIRGKIEEQNFQIGKILQRQRELLLAFDVQSQQLQQAATRLNNQDGGVTTVAKQPVSTSSTPTAGSTSDVGNIENETEAYRAAVDLILKQRDTKAAIPILEAFVQNYTESKFKPNAHYWLGQIFYNERRWPKAKEHFGILVANYSDSNKIADAMLKLGITEKNLGNTNSARRLLSTVTEKYADSTPAKLAQEQLNLL